LAGHSDIPVAAGCDRPLVRRAYYPQGCHGADGLGGVELPAPRLAASGEHAIDLLARTAAEGSYTLIEIGPLTNVAVFLARYPEAARRIERVVVMGGASFEGNTTPAAEFNIWVDPEAAARVLGAGFDLTLLPLDVTHQAFLDDADLREIGAREGRPAAIVAAMLATYRAHHLRAHGSTEMPMHYALAVFEAIGAQAIAKSPCRVAVDCSSELSRGATVIARSRVFGERPNASVGCSVDRRAFVDLLIERISALG
jgi:inosine-uridine nucleoside N-ribohydrolase